jgi:hypothetical protein
VEVEVAHRHVDLFCEGRRDYSRILARDHRQPGLIVDRLEDRHWSGRVRPRNYFGYSRGSGTNRGGDSPDLSLSNLEWNRGCHVQRKQGAGALAQAKPTERMTVIR